MKEGEQMKEVKQREENRSTCKKPAWVCILQLVNQISKSETYFGTMM